MVLKPRDELVNAVGIEFVRAPAPSFKIHGARVFVEVERSVSPVELRFEPQGVLELRLGSREVTANRVDEPPAVRAGVSSLQLVTDLVEQRRELEEFVFDAFFEIPLRASKLELQTASGSTALWPEVRLDSVEDYGLGFRCHSSSPFVAGSPLLPFHTTLVTEGIVAKKIPFFIDSTGEILAFLMLLATVVLVGLHPADLGAGALIGGMAVAGATAVGSRRYKHLGDLLRPNASVSMEEEI